jgi:hypothetical protein
VIIHFAIKQTTDTCVPAQRLAPHLTAFVNTFRQLALTAQHLSCAATGLRASVTWPIVVQTKFGAHETTDVQLS